MSDPQLAFTPAEPHDRRKGPRPLYVFLLILAVLAFAGLIIGRVLIRPFSIPSEAMAPTVIKGDLVLVRNFSGPPARGDVIVFLQPLNGRTTYVKRVIGMPGERVQITDGKVYVNGQGWDQKPLAKATENMGGWSRPVFRLQETNADGRKYVVNDYGPDGDLDNTEVYQVPPGHYFVMGDNRDNSLDSRVPKEMGGGFVPAGNVIGRVVLVLGDQADRPNGSRP